jgi:high-affinity iron transporter
MFATYLIGLREGLEATLVVSILIAFLVKAERKDRLVQVWAGVALAVVLSVFFGWLLSYTSTSLLSRSEDRELFEAITSILAVVFVTWMIFWMRRAARSIAGALRSKLTDALAVGSFAVAVMAFLSVVREGLETSLIFYSAVQGAATTSKPLIGLLAGIATSVVLGFLLYASAVRINLTKFFTWTGAILILVAAGILKYGVHDLQEAGVLPGLNNLAYDVSGVLDPSAWYTALLTGMVNITPTASWIETIAWVAYAVPVLLLFLRPARRRPAPAVAPAPTSGSPTAPGTEPAPAPETDPASAPQH